VAAAVGHLPAPSEATGHAANEDIATTFKVAETARQAIARVDQLIDTASK